MAPIANPALVFTGFMGAGKSRALRHAKAAGLDAVDADLLLAEELGGSIADFFAANGEEEFRRREAELVVRVLSEGHAAVALGGGAVLSEAVREALGAAHGRLAARSPVGPVAPRAGLEPPARPRRGGVQPSLRRARAALPRVGRRGDALRGRPARRARRAARPGELRRREADLGAERVGLLPGLDRRGRPRHGGRRRPRQAVLRERHERGAALPGRRRRRGGDRRPRG